ncbi:M56 family metallopeptidase [Maribacter sp. R77961]|uniref:M56 family metallopeptidase n=1 Tax=Maribacter sp. R77961 TaxID=3093871 RepID=UPI0037C846B7
MLEYLLKSGACMAVFLLFHKLFLEQENMHVFKRYFLLSAIIASLVIPNIVFTSYVETVSENFENLTNGPYVAVVSKESTDIDMINWSLIITSIYFVGILFSSFRFFKNLSQILRRIKGNPKFRQASSIKVLLKEVLPPHTFFNYVFLNRKKFEENSIPQEVLLHEETHAKQRHSLDVLFIELMQVILWFNPFVYLFKKAIKLNHEFLADKAVLKHEIQTKNYQNTLLSYLSKESLEKYQSTGIANAINYSSIKKRFTVMKKRTSKRAAILRGLLLLPVLTLLLISFTETKTITIQSKEIVLDKVESTSEATKREVYQRATIQNFNEWKNSKKYALWLDEKNIDNTELKNYKPSQIAHFMSSFVYENARSIRYPQPFQVHLYTENGLAKIVAKNTNSIKININSNGKILLGNNLVTLKELKNSLLRLNKTLTQKEREQQVSAVINVAPDTPKAIIQEVDLIVTAYGVAEINIRGQEPAYIGILKENKTVQSRIEKYNVLAKKYNAVPLAKRKIPLNDLKIMERIYKGMTKIERKESQPFPECLPQENKVKQFNLAINNNQLILNNEKLTIANFSDKVDELTRNWEETDYTSIKALTNVQNSSKTFLKAVEKEFSKTHFSKANEGMRLFHKKSDTKDKQDGASRRQMSAYNTLAKKYNEMDSDRMRILKSDVERLEYIYSLMSDKQKNDAEPFPDFPKPPPAPQPANSIKSPIPPKSPRVLKGEVSAIPPPPSVNRPRTIEGKVGAIPTPPEPIAPLDHVIEMAKKGAAFFYEGNEISSDEAIKLMKNNKDLNIDSRTAKGKKPVVRITVAPIYH